MAGKHPPYPPLKCYTEEAIIVSPSDWNKLACEVIPDIISRLSDNKYFFGYDPNGGIPITNTLQDLRISVEEKKDDGYIHDTNSAEVEITLDGDFEITTDAGFNLSKDATIELSIFIDRDDGNGWEVLPGSLAYCGD
jgi:hypothetical protein